MIDEELLPFCECGCGKRVTRKENRFIQWHSKNRLGTGKPISEALPCECGCGELAKPGDRFIHGHNGRKTPWDEILIALPCECGCGELSKPGNRFIKGHQNRDRKFSDEARLNMAEAHLKEKEPLFDGWQSKIDKMATNKDCATYLGCYIAERLLSKVFKNVRMMPITHHGYDAICNHDKKIDVKSSSTGDKGHWMFDVNKNAIADYFLCIAFDNREDLNIEHVWLIPGNDINQRTAIRISKSRLDRWIKYEQPIDKAILCCNEMRENA